MKVLLRERMQSKYTVLEERKREAREQQRLAEAEKVGEKETYYYNIGAKETYYYNIGAKETYYYAKETYYYVRGEAPRGAGGATHGRGRKGQKTPNI